MSLSNRQFLKLISLNSSNKNSFKGRKIFLNKIIPKRCEKNRGKLTKIGENWRESNLVGVQCHRRRSRVLRFWSRRKWRSWWAEPKPHCKDSPQSSMAAGLGRHTKHSPLPEWPGWRIPVQDRYLNPIGKWKPTVSRRTVLFLLNFRSTVDWNLDWNVDWKMDWKMECRGFKKDNTTKNR